MSTFAKDATILDWVMDANGKFVVLRKGSTGWSCFPDTPGTPTDDPMCVDDQWMSFINALMTKATPHITRVGVGYMAARGGAHGSNVDPFATKATPDNEWGYDPPHVMLLVTDVKELQGLPTNRQSGGPWVMWTGTPYAHIMVPVASTKK